VFKMISLGNLGSTAAGRAMPIKSHPRELRAASMPVRVLKPPVTIRTRSGKVSRTVLANSKKKLSLIDVDAFCSEALEKCVEVGSIAAVGSAIILGFS